MNSTNSKLEIDALAKSFGGVRVFSDVTFQAPVGQVTALVGPNGAGKSTLVNIICGVVRADHGQIRKDGRILNGVRPGEAVARGIARTFQDVRVFPTLTLLENVLVAFPHQPGDNILRLLGRRWHKVEERNRTCALDLLEQLGLASDADVRAEAVPFGSQKLAGVARAVATGADTLLFDEASTGVEAGRILQLTEFIRHLRTDGKTILLIEHNIDVVADIADWAVVLQGTVIAEGQTDRVLRDERVIRDYLGRIYDA